MLYALLIFVVIAAISISIYLSIQIQRFRKNEIEISEELTIEEILRSDIPDYKKGIALNNFLQGHWLIWKDIQRLQKTEISISDEPTIGEILCDRMLELRQSEGSRHPLEGISLSERDIGILYGRAILEKFYENGQNRLPKVPEKLLDEFGVVEQKIPGINVQAIIKENLDPEPFSRIFSTYKVKFS